MSLVRIFIGIFLATGGASARMDPTVSGADSFTKAPPGLVDCPPGTICPLLNRREEIGQPPLPPLPPPGAAYPAGSPAGPPAGAPAPGNPAAKVVGEILHTVTKTDEDCEKEHAAQLPAQRYPAQPQTRVQVVTQCPPEVTDCGAAHPQPTHACNGEDCTVEEIIRQKLLQQGAAKPIAGAPVQPKPAVCVVIEKCPECAPHVCRPCRPDDLSCRQCQGQGCLPPCPEHCPVSTTSVTQNRFAPLQTPARSPVGALLPSPSPTPTKPYSVALPVRPTTTTTTPSPTPTTGVPTAAADRAHGSPGVYMGMAAVFVAINWF